MNGVKAKRIRDRYLVNLAQLSTKYQTSRKKEQLVAMAIVETVVWVQNERLDDNLQGLVRNLIKKSRLNPSGIVLEAIILCKNSRNFLELFETAL